MRKLTLQDVILRAKLIHGDRYDYSIAQYGGGKVKMEIACPQHGSFFQNPNNHINNKQGCPSCSGRDTWTIDTFIQEAKKKHKDRFNYKHLIGTVYQGQKATNIKLECSYHGWFTCSAYDHLRYPDGGCSDCAENKRRTTRRNKSKAGFLKWFSETKALDLVLVSEYKGMTYPIQVRCLKHDLITTTKPTLLRSNASSGCDSCKREKLSIANRLTFDEIKKAYAASLPDSVELISSRFCEKNGSTMVTVQCDIHGHVEMPKATFANSIYRCTECGNDQVGYAGYRIRGLMSGDERFKSRPTRIALMQVNALGIDTYKLGVTTRTLEARYRESLLVVYFEAVLDELDALLLEQLLHQKYQKDQDQRVKNKGMREGKRWSGDEEVYFKRAVKPMLVDLKLRTAELEHRDADYWNRFPELKIPSAKPRESRFSHGVYQVSKRVICLDSLEIYPSATEAAKTIGASQGNLSMACRGERETVKGLKFAYLEDYENNTISVFKPGRGTKRYVRCIDTGEVFESLTIAADSKGLDSSKIGMVCKGKRKTTGGLHWEYLEGMVD